MEWYERERRRLRALGRHYGRSEAVACGVAAALSPRMRWPRNVALVRRALALGYAAGALPRSCQQAQLILEGERPLDVLRGPKVRAFYRALRGDEEAAVVDVWIARALGHRGRFPEGPVYRALASRLTRRARRAALPVTTYQARLWVAARGGRPW